MPETRHQSHDSFGARRELSLPDASTVTIFDPGALERAGIGRVGRLPFSIRILLENLLRHEDGGSVTADDIEALAMWEPEKEREIAFRPARVILQDFTGVPAVVDLAAMRDAMLDLGGDPSRINPLMPSELVIDHSVQVDSFGLLASLLINAEKEFERNRERYEFLRWGQEAFENFRVVPPSTGIVHQVNLEYLARVVFEGRDGDGRIAYPDTLVGTDSHTTMINGLGVLGWGVGGIEAEAAMLGQPISFLVPEVIGFRLEGRLPDGATATDLVLRVTEMLRQRGVVGRFVEFYGPGLPALSLADRATLGNMSPEFGSTCAIFPIDAETLAYLRFSGRSEDQVALVEAYARETGLFHEPGAPPADYTDALSLDLETVEPSIAGPKLPQQRIALANARRSFGRWLSDLRSPAPAANGGAGARMSAEGGGANAADVPARVRSAHVSWQTLEGEPTEFEVSDGSVVIAAITSCTNTSNPSVMVGAGLVAKKAVELGLERKPWVKTSLAPGSKVVTEYLREADLLDDLEALGFAVVGYGCTTCIGNSGPLPVPISKAIREEDLAVCAVLSGNRNFEGRINPDTRANYLASPPLVVAYALAGTMDIDLATEPLGTSRDGQAVFLADIWPSQDEIRAAVRTSVRTEQFREQYADVFRGDEQWRSLPVPEGERYTWAEESTYVRRPPFFEGMSAEPTPPGDIRGARVLVSVGDSVTTDHISPAGAISPDSPAARYLEDHGVPPAEFNSYGSRRGNHEVMMRGTFANVRLRNRLVPGVEGGFTRHLPDGEELSIYDAAMRYADEGVPLIVLAGAEYGTGSSRDWAAKGPALLGIRAVIAVGYERIHRSNLIGMGILPLQFEAGASAESLGLDGTETYTIGGISDGLAAGGRVRVSALHETGTETEFEVDVRLDTEVELDYYRNGGILQTVLRQMLDD
ncbi:MAG: aconitate hydratase AcnA [marine benthic group bacterium]|nr:aconitate hydratase AcnA [Candidatus Carthagonibacter metallireducens]MCL7969304.1 aconitate hydratase AcnA [Gemmatimonadota bacterium]